MKVGEISRIQRNHVSKKMTNESIFEDFISFLPPAKRCNSERQHGISQLQDSTLKAFTQRHPDDTFLLNFEFQRPKEQLIGKLQSKVERLQEEGLRQVVNLLQSSGNIRSVAEYLSVIEEQWAQEPHSHSQALTRLCDQAQKVLGRKFAQNYPGLAAKRRPNDQLAELIVASSARKLSFCQNQSKRLGEGAVDSFIQSSEEGKLRLIEQLEQNLAEASVIFQPVATKLIEVALGDCSEKVVLRTVHLLGELGKYWQKQAYRLVKCLLPTLLSKLGSQKQVLLIATIEVLAELFKSTIGVADFSQQVMKNLHDKSKQLKLSTVRLVGRLLPCFEEKARPDDAGEAEFLRWIAEHLSQQKKCGDKDVRSACESVLEAVSKTLFDLENRAKDSRRESFGVEKSLELSLIRPLTERRGEEISRDSVISCINQKSQAHLGLSPEVIQNLGSALPARRAAAFRELEQLAANCVQCSPLVRLLKWKSNQFNESNEEVLCCMQKVVLAMGSRLSLVDFQSLIPFVLKRVGKASEVSFVSAFLNKVRAAHPQAWLARLLKWLSKESQVQLNLKFGNFVMNCAGAHLELSQQQLREIYFHSDKVFKYNPAVKSAGQKVLRRLKSLGGFQGEERKVKFQEQVPTTRKESSAQQSQYFEGVCQKFNKLSAVLEWKKKYQQILLLVDELKKRQSMTSRIMGRLVEWLGAKVKGQNKLVAKTALFLAQKMATELSDIFRPVSRLIVGAALSAFSDSFLKEEAVRLMNWIRSSKGVREIEEELAGYMRSGEVETKLAFLKWLTPEDVRESKPIQQQLRLDLRSESKKVQQFASAFLTSAGLLSPPPESPRQPQRSLQEDTVLISEKGQPDLVVERTANEQQTVSKKLFTIHERQEELTPKKDNYPQEIYSYDISRFACSLSQLPADSLDQHLCSFIVERVRGVGSSFVLGKAFRYFEKLARQTSLANLQKLIAYVLDLSVETILSVSDQLIVQPLCQLLIEVQKKCNPEVLLGGLLDRLDAERQDRHLKGNRLELLPRLVHGAFLEWISSTEALRRLGRFQAVAGDRQVRQALSQKFSRSYLQRANLMFAGEEQNESIYIPRINLNSKAGEDDTLVMKKGEFDLLSPVGLLQPPFDLALLRERHSDLLEYFSHYDPANYEDDEHVLLKTVDCIANNYRNYGQADKTLLLQLLRAMAGTGYWEGGQGLLERLTKCLLKGLLFQNELDPRSQLMCQLNDQLKELVEKANLDNLILTLAKCVRNNLESGHFKCVDAACKCIKLALPRVENEFSQEGFSRLIKCLGQWDGWLSRESVRVVLGKLIKQVYALVGGSIFKYVREVGLEDSEVLTELLGHCGSKQSQKELDELAELQLQAILDQIEENKSKAGFSSLAEFIRSNPDFNVKSFLLRKGLSEPLVVNLVSYKKSDELTSFDALTRELLWKRLRKERGALGTSPLKTE